MQSVKCVVIGDGAVGKTSMLLCHCSDVFPDEYIPTVFDNYKTNIKYHDTYVQLCLWDTAGQDDYDKIRPLSYPQTDVILVCFAVDNNSSFQNIEQKWCPEIAYYCPNIPYILVGTKVDIREESDNAKRKSSEKTLMLITHNQGQSLANKIGAVKYMECSAKTQKGLQEVFEQAVRAVIVTERRRKRRGKRCHFI